ncbi:hypothetical protein [Paraburkholderia sp. HD33-4]|uniref:hypothetical protein n=1 Tax=Paraburkholderia sp. HD33-4 TaxID=2883242 RepID=UPI001F28347E|nr:hypothetical protein [Paraburkholderia sp. HD33-4]
MNVTVLQESATAVADSDACKRRPDGGLALMNSTGWAIARYAVYVEWRDLLWEPVNLCWSSNGAVFHGPLNDVRDALWLHRRFALHEAE